MARFLISPGVITREVDNSQYTATIPAGSVAALVGYAEKGPFDPTMVSGPQEFIETFGKTLEDAPYLAQAAYKYFEQADQLLVVRAGSSKDPAAYPQAAQHSSKSIRIAPEDTVESAGLQAFSATSPIPGGSYAPGANYDFRVVLDHRAFDSQYLEKWTGIVSEAAVGLVSSKVAVKIAMTSSDSTTFTLNYKREHGVASTDEYIGTGTRSGSDLGNTFTVTLRQYRDDDSYVEDPNDYIQIIGEYGAATLGNVNLDSGETFAGESFELTLGENSFTVTPTSTTFADADEIVTELNAAFAIADLSGTPTDITSEVLAFVSVPDSGVAYVGIKHIGGSDSEMTLAVGASDALVLLGISADTYSDEESITGVWNSSTGTESFDGTFIFKFESTMTSESFEDIVNVSVISPTEDAWALSDIMSQINAQLANAYDGDHTDEVDFWGNLLVYSYTQARGSASLDSEGRVQIDSMQETGEQGKSIVRISLGVGNSLIDLLGGTEIAVDGEVASTIGEALITLQAAEKGSFGNNLIFRVEKETVQINATDDEDRWDIYILWNGKEVSIYRRLLIEAWTDPTSDNYIPTLLANDRYIRVEAEDEDTDEATMGILPNGDWLLGSGSLPDGVLAADAEITAFVEGTNGWTLDNDGAIEMTDDIINALLKIYNPEIYDFNLIAAPGDASKPVQNAIQSLCDSRRDCFGLIDASPFGTGLGVASGAVHISAVNEDCDTLTSNYVGAYWSWLQDYDADNQQYVWLPPSIYALKQMVYTDNVADPWAAPAGLRRGRISAIDVEYSPSKTDRDILYGGTAIVNPIVKFVNEGIVIWGQKTAQRTKSALDRINVRRLLIYAEKLIARMARGFLFEPHDQANWAAFARQANAILEPIRQRRGLTTYQVICDSTTNTAALIDQNIMAGKIFLQPTKTIEFIEVEFTINAAGEVEITE